MYETIKEPNSQSNPEKEQKAGSTTLPNFKLHYKAIVSNSVVLQKRDTDQGNRIKSPGKNPLIYVTMLLNGETITSSKNAAGKTDNHMQENETGSLSCPQSKHKN